MASETGHLADYLSGYDLSRPCRRRRQDNDNEPDNKLNKLIASAYRIWRESGENEYLTREGKPFDLPGAAQMIFSDLGTISVEKSRGFSAYRWIRDELVRFGVPPSEIAFLQDYHRIEAKHRLFADVNAGKVRLLIGSFETMGTGVNAQLRLKSLHHLDVPWLPSQIEQREGRIERQGNQHDEIDIFAYATEGSMDAQMWQNNERKAGSSPRPSPATHPFAGSKFLARGRPPSSPWPKRSLPAISA